MTLSSKSKSDLCLTLRLRRAEPKAPFTKEERKARNRLTAKKSRDRRNAYIEQLETNLRLANERVMELERRIEGMAHAQEAEQADELFFLSTALNEDIY